MNTDVRHRWYAVPAQLVQDLPHYRNHSEIRLIAYIATYAGATPTIFTNRELMLGSGIKSSSTLYKAIDDAKANGWLQTCNVEGGKVAYWISPDRAAQLSSTRGLTKGSSATSKHRTNGRSSSLKDEEGSSPKTEEASNGVEPHGEPENGMCGGAEDDHSSSDFPIVVVDLFTSSMGRDRGVGEEKPNSSTSPSKAFKKPRTINGKGKGKNQDSAAPAGQHRAPATELELLIVGVLNEDEDTKPKNGRLTKTGVRKLNAPVTSNGNIYPSPEEFWRTDPEYCEWLQDRIDYFLTSNHHEEPLKAQDYILNLICKYHNNGHGFIDFKNKLAAQRVEEEQRQHELDDVARRSEEYENPEEEARVQEQMQQGMAEADQILAASAAKKHQEQITRDQQDQKEIDEWLQRLSHQNQ